MLVSSVLQKDKEPEKLSAAELKEALDKISSHISITKDKMEHPEKYTGKPECSIMKDRNSAFKK